ncbi:bifunctional oligoribonuclease/PAP phosphatase NrnA [Crocinitomicaceae bacterium]|jgi:phosphoesterase RecJ-like protein|nr:bifunctional oligoribonuclease/PAP phosphatase NrnA [Crocinitomicaceae bacterium]MDB4682616.1 bifunctional oligoribonuclease/PAP phosphatase NrnA [Crocinitomicaceae bacterium]
MIETFKKLLNDANTILITSHKSPDGDAVGSSVACYEFLKSIGKDPYLLLPDPPASNLMPFLEDVQYSFYEGHNLDLSRFELVFCLDYNHEYRVGEEMSSIFELLDCKKIMIDHHPEPSEFCDLTISRPEVCSTAQLFFEVLEELEMSNKLNLKGSKAVYLGIMTDTGSFRYPSVTAKTHDVLAKVISNGVVPFEIHESIFDQNTGDQLKLRGFAVSDKMELIEGSPVGLISLSMEELNRFNYKKGDTEGLVNVILSIKGVSIAIFMVENDEGKVKMSFRSKGKYYVNDFAKKHFNGGGHKYAAGGFSHLNLAETKNTVLEFYKELL